jgi:hypothetical protein
MTWLPGPTPNLPNCLAACETMGDGESIPDISPEFVIVADHRLQRCQVEAEFSGQLLGVFLQR